MTPCVEHFLRYFSVGQLYFPFTLLVSKESNKLVIGINKSRKNGFSIKQWKLFETTKEDALPVLDKFYIKNLEDLVKDERIVVPEYKLLSFKEIQHKKETQEATGYYARMQENKYKRDIENFLYPEIQKAYRMNWIWNEFCRIHEMTEYTGSINMFSLKLKYQMSEIWNKWLLWKKHLLQAKNIAPELLFYKAYKVQTYDSIKPKNYINTVGKNGWTQLYFDTFALNNNFTTGSFTYTITTG